MLQLFFVRDEDVEVKFLISTETSQMEKAWQATQHDKTSCKLADTF
jgi:hypothetical protein